jgi:predicted CopG family antitoxin
MSDDRATIAIAQETRDRLWNQKNGSNDTYDDVINRLIDLKEKSDRAEELGETTREVLEE